MSLSILTDEQIRGLLENLTFDELEDFRNELKSALHEYSNGTQAVDEGMLHQPERTSVHSSTTGATTLFMPSCSPGGYGVKVITLSSAAHQDPTDDRPVIRPIGAITLFNPEGRPVGLLHASTLTAFRTALASACLLIRRNLVRTLTVFGAGQQAYWHIRLALLLRGRTVRQVNIVNRRFSEGCKLLLRQFSDTPPAVKEREGWSGTTFGILTPGYQEYARLVSEQLRAADVIFCCTPSTEPLFDGSILTSHEGRRKGRLIVAIGSYTPEMRELPVELLQQAVKPHEAHHFHYHKHAAEGGVVVVDTLDGALKEAGEIIEARLRPRQLVELGELVMLHRIAKAQAEESETSSTTTATSSSSSSRLSAEFAKLDFGSGSVSSSAMSNVFGPERKRSSSSRASASPHRKSSGSLLSSQRRSSSHGSADRKKQKEDHLARWLQGGNVIYKSVGLGLMDLAVGMKLIRVAKEKGVGTHIEGF